MTMATICHRSPLVQGAKYLKVKAKNCYCRHSEPDLNKVPQSCQGYKAEAWDDPRAWGIASGWGTVWALRFWKLRLVVLHHRTVSHDVYTQWTSLPWLHLGLWTAFLVLQTVLNFVNFHNKGDEAWKETNRLQAAWQPMTVTKKGRLSLLHLPPPRQHSLQVLEDITHLGVLDPNCPRRQRLCDHLTLRSDDGDRLVHCATSKRKREFKY